MIFVRYDVACFLVTKAYFVSFAKALLLVATMISPRSNPNCANLNNRDSSAILIKATEPPPRFFLTPMDELPEPEKDEAKRLPLLIFEIPCC